MLGLHPVRNSVGAALPVWIILSGCAAPKEVDYSAPDASAAPDAPVAIAVDPREGKEDVNRLQVIRITFDKHLDSRSLKQGRLTLRSGTVGRWMLSYYDPLHRQLVAWPSGPMLRQTTWVLDVNKGLYGLNGLPVYPSQITWFRTGDETKLVTPFQVRSFEREVRPIFEAHCVACHGGSGEGVSGLKLDSAAHIEETALNEPAVGWQNWTLIEPTRPGESYLLFKVIGDENLPGKTMPRAMGDEDPPRLSYLEKTILMDWIASGAAFFDPE